MSGVVDFSEYGLRERPFELRTDSRFLWLQGPHWDAFAALHTGVLRQEELLLLTGDMGTGKTILTNALAELLEGAGTIVGRVSHPSREPIEFLRRIARAYDRPAAFDARDPFLLDFRGFLDAVSAKRERVLLVIDEAQSLTPEMFVEIKHLIGTAAQARKDGRSGLSVLLVGEVELRTALDGGDPVLARLIKTRCDLRPLSVDDTGAYIRYRLQVAGAERELFTPRAVREIWSATDGIPRLINVVGDRALLHAARSGVAMVGPEVIRVCGDEPSGRSEPVEIVTAPDAGRTWQPTRGALAGRARIIAVIIAGCAAVLGVVISVAGNLPLSGRDSGLPSPPVPAETTRSTTGEERAETTDVRRLVEPVNGSKSGTDAIPGAPRATDPLPSAPAETPIPAVPRKDSAERAERPAPQRAAVQRQDKDAAPPPASAPAVLPRDAATRKAADAPDPADIIDWLLKEHAPRTD